MEYEEWTFDREGMEEGVADGTETAEQAADHFGTNLALFVLCIAVLIAAISVFYGPSFVKCSVLTNVTERNACYEALRTDLFKPPTKGAE